MNKSPVTKPSTNPKKDVSLVDIMNTIKIMRNDTQSINSKLLTQENTSIAILNRMDSLSAEIILLKNENVELKRDIEKLKTNPLDHRFLTQGPWTPWGSVDDYSVVHGVAVSFLK
jgi:protein gp37